MRYRHILFTPDPYTSERFVVGAVWRDGDVNRVIMATDPPCEHCIGSKAAAQLRLVTSGLGAAMPSFVELPEHVGPHFQLGASRDLPVGVEPAEWIAGSFPKRCPLTPPAD